MARSKRTGTRVPGNTSTVRTEVSVPPDPDGRTPEQVEEDEQTGFVLRLRLRGLSERDIARACRAQYGFGAHRTNRLLRRVLEGLREEAETNRPYTRGEQIARIRGQISDLNGVMADERRREAGPRSEVVARVAEKIVQFERLLAEVEGNREPEHLVVHQHLTGALAVVTANLTEERAAELLARARERRRLAEGRQAVPALVVDSGAARTPQ